MKGYELDALKRLNIPVVRWGKGGKNDYRVKVKNDIGRFIFISNISRPKYQTMLAKTYKKKQSLLTKHITPNYKSSGAYEFISGKSIESHCWYGITQAEFEIKAYEKLVAVNKAFKVNIQLGYILVERTSGIEREYWPSTDSSVFDRPVAINSRRDIHKKLFSELSKKVLSERLRYPGSAWQMKSVNAFKLIFFKRDHILGSMVPVPDYIRNNQFIIDFNNKDNNCVFYCLAYALGEDMNKKRMVAPTKEAYKKWCEFNKVKYTAKAYKESEAVDLMEFDKLEDCFQAQIHVYTFKEVTYEFERIRESEADYEKRIDILDHHGHALLITRLDVLLAKYVCGKCGMIFEDKDKLRKHKQRVRECDEDTIESFSETNYEPRGNQMKAMLNKYGIKDVDPFVDGFIVYDFESRMEEIEDGEHGFSTKYTNKHVPMSFAVCDSTGESKFILRRDPQKLMHYFVDELNRARIRVADQNDKKFRPLLYAIMKQEEEDTKAKGKEMEKDEDGDEIYSSKDYKWLISYCTCIPVVGINSGKYDFNLIKPYLLEALSCQSDDVKRVIKVGSNSYMCVATDNFNFIDISNYLPAGTSYVKYLETYLGGCKCKNKIQCTCGKTKGVFPYEYITSYNKLLEGLPPKSAFYSKKDKLACSEEDYERVKFIWKHYELKDIRDLLKYYNLEDVKPFMQAVVKHRDFYRKFDLDMFKDAVSLPGLAEKIMYQYSYKDLKFPERKPVKPFSFDSERIKGYLQQDKERAKNAGRSEDDVKTDLTKENLNELLEKQGYYCKHCDKPLDVKSASADRINNNKDHTIDNIVISCVECNTARKNKCMKAFRRSKLVEANEKKIIWSLNGRKEYKLAEDAVFANEDERRAALNELKKENSIYHKMKDNIAGGPSIIFNRFAKACETTIRGGDKQVKKVIGYDANALYLWCLGNDMPCGRLGLVRTGVGFGDDMSGGDDKYGYKWFEEVVHEFIHYDGSITRLTKEEDCDIYYQKEPFEFSGGVEFKFEVKENLGGGKYIYHKFVCPHGDVFDQNEILRSYVFNDGRNETTYIYNIRNETTGEIVGDTHGNCYNKTSLFKRLKGVENEEWVRCVDGEKKPYHRSRNIKHRGKPGFIEAVLNDKIFGFAEVDIETPEHLKDYFSEMCPIFKNIEIDPNNKELIGEHMWEYNQQKLAKAREEYAKLTADGKPAPPLPTFTKSKKLIGSYFGKKILIYTPLLKWYLQHGLEVKHIYSFIYASRSRPFEKFTDEVSEARREGDQTPRTVAKEIIRNIEDIKKVWKNKNQLKDFEGIKNLMEKIINGFEKANKNKKHYDLIEVDMIIEGAKILKERDEEAAKKLGNLLLKLIDVSSGSKKMLGDMMKLIGNSAFGRAGMDKSKHKEVKFCFDEKSVRQLIEKPQFVDLEEYGDSSEVLMKKRMTKLTNPIHVSIAIYQLAKLRMLQFYYDCVDYYFDRSDFQYQEMDTDSAYIAFSDTQPFKNLFKTPELKAHFEEHKNEWFPREDLEENNLYDQKTPGLFKEEWRGDAIVSLSPKNYICYLPDEVGGKDGKIKISAKGIQQGGNKNKHILNPEAFEQVVNEKVSFKATNTGFRIDKSLQGIVSYEQIKTGLNYYYDKRRVLEDGISTVPLDL